MARKSVVVAGQSGVYHCVSRCVRRAFLCGQDSYSGNNYEHRRAWFQNRLKELNELFTVDFLAYAIMSNHWHCVIQTRPGQAEALSDEEVVRRWMGVFPKRREGDKQEQEAAFTAELRATVRDKKRVAELRERLSSVSWFMKSMNEYIARRSNHEDSVKGRFWEGRFGCQRLLDDATVLTCMAYVDLNPVRARMAESLEDSEFTSAYDRVQAARSRERRLALEREQLEGEATVRQQEEIARSLAAQGAASWLASLDGPDRVIGCVNERLYLELLDRTGRCIREDKPGAISPEVVPILESLGLDADEWVRNVQRYGKLFYRVAGRAEAIAHAAHECGARWLKGRTGSEALFASPAAAQPVPGG